MTSSFPIIDLVPKKETKALEYCQKFPTYNGKGVTIGILDTGIDPGAAGIRYMEDGVTPKLMDLVDCTGSGDVSMTEIQELTKIDKDDGGADGGGGYYQLEGLSGRTLKLPLDLPIQPLPNSSTTSGSTSTSTTTTTTSGTTASSTTTDTSLSVRLGLKRVYELFPDSVTNRCKAHRKQLLEQELNGYIADIRKQLAALPGDDSKWTPTQVQQQRDDLQAKLETLTDKEWDEDPGVLLDCVVFWNGDQYGALIDSSETGDLRQTTPLYAYRYQQQYATISIIDQYNYGVQFYDNGTILSIVGDSTPHGTHVAGIAAGALGDRSGVAPGAKLISLKIGDSRMSAMESGSAIIRGIMEAVRLGCDVINLSYGEGCQYPNAGKVIQCAEEMVWRHNIVFVSAVGNNGPALSTVNAPGGLSSCIMGVAAYVSPDMMKANYSLQSNNITEDDLVGTTYTWSSVGPAADGANGVSVCAPGGAIASVSNWTMQKSQLMNGTSMSSPHACGCVALLLSACKAEAIPISPPRIQRAIENTCQVMTMMPDLTCLQQGWGMIQVDKALEYLQTHKDIATEDVRFEVFLDGRAGDPRGIYLRQAEESSVRQSFGIRVNPKFQRQGAASLQDETQKNKIQFEMQVRLESTVDWVSTPDHFMLMNNGRVFKISVDPTKLQPGVHTAKILGRDAEHPERGVMFSVPITVIKPLKEERMIELRELKFEATEVKRFFVVPPAGATWMDVTVRDRRVASEDGGSSRRLFVLHTLQLIPHAAYRDYAHQKYLNLSPSQTSVTSIPIEAGITTEVDIGRYWSAAGVTKADVSIEFRGIRPVPSEVSMNSGDYFSLVRIHSELQDEVINPSAKLTKWKTPLRPKSEGVITPLGERDIQPWNEKKTYQLVLTYEFTQDEKGSFTPRAPALQEVLYEASYESQIMLVFDGDKKYLGFSDAYPSSVTAPKGTVVIRMQVRHDDPAMLEKLNDMTIWIERKMDKEISLSAHETRESLLVNGKRAMRKRTLRKGGCASVFFTEPPTSKLPSTCKTGDVLMGAVYYGSGESSLPGEGKRPNGFPLSYTVGPKMDKPSSDPDVPEPKDERTAEERMNEAIRDIKVDQLGKLTSSEKESGKFEELYVALEAEYSDHVPLLMVSLKYIDNHKKRSDMLEKLLAAADKVIAQISEDELALHFGRKLDKEDPEKVKLNKEMEKKKGFLIEALARKGHAIAEMETEDASAKFDDVLSKLKAWADIDANGKYAALALERDCRAGRHGAALKRINKLLSKPGKEGNGGVKTLTKAELFEKRSEILEKIGYGALASRDKGMRLIASPKDYPLF